MREIMVDLSLFFFIQVYIYCIKRCKYPFTVKHNI
ncbi:hypothetical protein Pint_10576 [Pistacia integerrima]|uniref:Uncharacterized protein n=1 Tax=Pistacia integerrima TaxID=434235 RepID=A0ACC0XH66_9ROSI|nr:hypothetical protein Pint_10576 [Pistacia integerrima]